MMWSYAILPDGTHIAYSDLQGDGTLRIAVERSRDWGFDSACCTMPAYRWSDIDGFTDTEIAELTASCATMHRSSSSLPKHPPTKG